MIGGPGIVLIGGETATGPSSEVWYLRPWETDNRAWEPAPDMPYPLSSLTAVFYAPTYYQHYIYVYGYGDGDSHLLEYNLDYETWTELQPPTMPPARKGHTAVSDDDRGNMIVCGGQDPITGEELNDCWRFFYAGLVWSFMNQLMAPLTDSAAAMLATSGGQAPSQQGTAKMVMFGGLSGGAPTNRTFLYTPTFRIYLPLVGKDFPAP